MSLRVVASAIVRADPQAAWDLYADVPGSVEWVPFAEEILYLSGPAGLGQVYRERTRMLGAAGAHAILVGEHLMRAPSPGAALRELLQ